MVPLECIGPVSYQLVNMVRRIDRINTEAETCGGGGGIDTEIDVSRLGAYYGL